MPDNATSPLEILSDWQDCDDEQMDFGGDDLEDATLGYFTMSRGGDCLTRGTHNLKSSRHPETTDGPLVPAYHAAEWMASNYWRLCYEPGLPFGIPDIKPVVDVDDELDWLATHHMSGIGNGYIWPNGHIVSDGQHVVIRTTKTKSPHSMFKYSFSGGIAVPLEEFQKAVDRFVEDTIGRLDGAGLRESDLHGTWSEVVEEIRSDDMSLYRRFEAIMGFDPDEGDRALVEGMIEGVRMVGEGTAAELARHNRTLSLAGLMARRPDTIGDLLEVADRIGLDSSPGDSARLRKSDPALGCYGRKPAWEIGGLAARSIRKQAGLNGGPVSNKKLAEMADVSPDRLYNGDNTPVSLSFSAVNDNSGSEKVVLKPAGERAVRFALARIIGDRALEAGQTGLHLAADTKAYRQKAQRAFAAELLCPAEEAVGQLGRNPSTDAVHRMARAYTVSTAIPRNHIENSGRSSDIKFAA